MRKLIPDVVKEQQLATMPASATVYDAARLMRDRRIGAVMIVEGDMLEGIFTERDMVNRVVAAGRDPRKTALAAVMTNHPATIDPRASALEALRRMNEGGFRHLPIVRDGRLLGIVSRRDLSGEEKAIIEDQQRLWERR